MLGLDYAVPDNVVPVEQSKESARKTFSESTLAWDKGVTFSHQIMGFRERVSKIIKFSATQKQFY